MFTPRSRTRLFITCESNRSRQPRLAPTVSTAPHHKLLRRQYCLVIVPMRASKIVLDFLLKLIHFSILNPMRIILDHPCPANPNTRAKTQIVSPHRAPSPHLRHGPPTTPAQRVRHTAHSHYTVQHERHRDLSTRPLPVTTSAPSVTTACTDTTLYPKLPALLPRRSTSGHTRPIHCTSTSAASRGHAGIAATL